MTLGYGMIQGRGGLGEGVVFHPRTTSCFLDSLVR